MYGKKRSLVRTLARGAKRMRTAYNVGRAVSTRLKTMKTRSMTRTRTRKRKRSGAATRVADIASTYASYYMAGYKKRSFPKKTPHTKLTFRTDAVTVVSSAAGRQRSLDMPLSTFNRTHLAVLFTKIRATATTQGWASQAENIKLVLSQCKLRTEIKNQTNDEVQVWIYDCVIRNDDAAANTPVVDWYNGANDQTDSTQTVDLFPYATPFQSDYFRENWRVIKVNKLMMKAGAVNTHNFTQKCNKTFSYSRFVNESDDSFGKLTCRSFVVLLGPIGHLAATPATVSYAPAKLDVIQTMTTKCIGMPDYLSYNRYDVNLSTVTPMVAITDVDESVNNIIVA